MGIEPGHNGEYRYPGTKFFETHQNRIFFGREQESRDLIHSIKAHDVFVIFADSGTGKTSLLNAGLWPEFEKEKIEPIRLRFQDISIAPINIITKKLEEYCPPSAYTNKELTPSLWRLFKCCDFKNKTPLFVLDQFEEFFNHTKQDKETCIDELADLVNEYLPDYIRDEMRQKFKEKDPTPEELKYYTPAHVKMLFLIRADKLKLLDDLSKKIPLILRNRFHLKPLNVMQAEEAIIRPALLPWDGFASPPFVFEPGAVKSISNYLKNQEDEVESFQLQLLCQELEKKIIRRYEENKEDKLVINEKELGGEAGMDNITKNYYTNQLHSITDEAMRKKAVELIEDRLIVEDRRISLPEILLLSEGYPKELLDYLLNTTRLIRIDNDRYVEISHDRLLSSILQSKQQRLEEERKSAEIRELQRLKEEQEEKNRLLKKQKEEEIKTLELEYLKYKLRKTKKLRIYLFLLVVLLVAFLYAGIDASRANVKANIALANYYMADLMFDQADSVLNKHNLFSFLNFYQDSVTHLQGDIRNEKKNYTAYKDTDAAFDKYSASLVRTGSLILTADSIAETGSTGNSPAFHTIGDTLEKALDPKDLLKARIYFANTQQTGYTPVDAEISVGSLLEDIDNKISISFKNCLDAAGVFLKANQLQGAQTAYEHSKALYDFATDSTHNIPLAAEDKDAFFRLQKILKQ